MVDKAKEDIFNYDLIMKSIFIPRWKLGSLIKRILGSYKNNNLEGV
jgi:hypothetical protein